MVSIIHDTHCAVTWTLVGSPFWGVVCGQSCMLNPVEASVACQNEAEKKAESKAVH